MHRHIHETRQCLPGIDLRDTGQWRRLQRTVTDDAQRAESFGDQHTAVGQEGEAPRVGQPVAHDADPDTLALRCPELDRRVGQRHHRDSTRRERLGGLLLRMEGRHPRDREHGDGHQGDIGTMHCYLPSESS